MSETYYVKTFGGLEITNDNVTVNIVELFGKQLVNLLQVLLFHSEKPVQKDELIDILWPESKNPSSALKFSIFRLRSELNEIDFFKDKEVIVTTRKGYILNPNLDWNIDFVELQKAYNQINEGAELLDEKEFKIARKIFRLYQGRFYASPSQLHWILQKQEVFRQMYVKTMMRTSCYLYTQKRYDEMMLMNYQAVLIEPFNEGLHYYYMKGLVATRNYREALKYYDELNDIFLSELGTGLSKRFKQLYDIIIADHAKEENKDMETIIRELSNRDQQNQGFFCSYEIFKYFYELLLKMSVRNEQNYYLIMLQFSDGTLDYEKVGVDFDRVKRLVSSCLRSNDLFTRTSETQLLLLVDCQTEENAHLIIQRISNKFYSIFRKKNYRMNYSVHKAELDRNR
ncbi:AfsR/SARP family transcriptional regulator [Holdemanella biformis]|jgi:DNA-binding SARP family transcriptional activator|uniref:AfsR/SARP family transcriptional regulator n=2 Tax=Holdemanella biformis TaxID=1735 RepID=UPI00241D5038|nr:BTAD domain-containing putative transcriptional regulator [Holdemanella biformis]MBS6454693.1 winged helix-turn-helix domain-containing protein [Holdemanella biformis]